MTNEDAEDLSKLSNAIDSFIALQRAQLRRLLPLQLFVCLLQLFMLSALVWMMFRVQAIAVDQKRNAEATEELTDRPTIELRAISSASAVIVVPPANSSGKPIELVLPPK